MNNNKNNWWYPHPPAARAVPYYSHHRVGRQWQCHNIHSRGRTYGTVHWAPQLMINFAPYYHKLKFWSRVYI